jgi:hypothetical protein
MRNTYIPLEYLYQIRRHHRVDRQADDAALRQGRPVKAGAHVEINGGMSDELGIHRRHDPGPALSAPDAFGFSRGVLPQSRTPFRGVRCNELFLRPN